MALEAGSVFARAEHLAWQWVAGEGVVLDLDHHVVRGLNGTGWRIWELLDGVRSLAQIAEAVAGEFQIPFERARADVASFLAELETRRLVARCA